MILVLNIGNSHISVGGFDPDGTLSFSGTIPTDQQKTDLEYVTALLRLFEEKDVPLSEITGGALSCVVPSILGIMKTALSRLFTFDFLEVNASLTPGFTIAMEDPRILGSNLVADTICAVRDYGHPVILIDMGNATSIGIVDRDSRYLGGLILPGIMRSLRALVGNTSLLPGIDLSSPKPGIGKNTIDAMQAGLVYGNAGMIDGVLDRVFAEYGEVLKDAQIVATGKLAFLIRPFLKHDITVDGALTLKGLCYAYLYGKEVRE